MLCGLFLQICNHPWLAPPCDEDDNKADDNDQNGIVVGEICLKLKPKNKTFFYQYLSYQSFPLHDVVQKEE